MSEAAGALVNGPESRYVVAALEALLDGDVGAARAALGAGAEAGNWAAVTHRLDVAGRALALDFPDGPLEPIGDGEPDVTAAVLDAWARGDGLPVAIDLTRGEEGQGSDEERAWVGLGVLASLVERSGFPPQVVV